VGRSAGSPGAGERGKGERNGGMVKEPGETDGVACQGV